MFAQVTGVGPVPGGPQATERPVSERREAPAVWKPPAPRNVTWDQWNQWDQWDQVGMGLVRVQFFHSTQGRPPPFCGPVA